MTKVRSWVAYVGLGSCLFGGTGCSSDSERAFTDTADEPLREEVSFEVAPRDEPSVPDFAEDHGDRLPALNRNVSGDPGTYLGGRGSRPQGPGTGNPGNNPGNPDAESITYSITPPPNLTLDGTPVQEGQFTLEEVTAYRYDGATLTSETILSANQMEIAIHAEIGSVAPKELFEVDDDIVVLHLVGFFDATLPDLAIARFDIYIFGVFTVQTDNIVFLPSNTQNSCVQVTGLGTTSSIADNLDVFISSPLSNADIQEILDLTSDALGTLLPSQSPLAGRTCATGSQMISHGTARNQVAQACDSQQVAGADTPETRTIEMGASSGTVTLDYNTYSQQDRVTVTYEGATLFDSGCVGTAASQMISFSGTSTQITVSVQPNCAGGTGTAWDFTLSCPN